MKALYIKNNINSMSRLIRTALLSFIVIMLIAAVVFGALRTPQVIENKVQISVQGSHKLNAGNLISDNNNGQKGFNNSQMDRTEKNNILIYIEHFFCPNELEPELLEFLIIFSFFAGKYENSKRRMIGRIKLSKKIPRLIISKYLHEKDGKKRLFTQLHKAGKYEKTFVGLTL